MGLTHLRYFTVTGTAQPDWVVCDPSIGFNQSQTIAETENYVETQIRVSPRVNGSQLWGHDGRCRRGRHHDPGPDAGEIRRTRRRERRRVDVSGPRDLRDRSGVWPGAIQADQCLAGA